MLARFREATRPFPTAHLVPSALRGITRHHQWWQESGATGAELPEKGLPNAMSSISHPTRRQFLASTGAAALAASLAACAPRDYYQRKVAGETDKLAGQPNPEGTIDAAISYELGTNGYDPMTTSAALTVAANWHTMEGLTEIDPATGKPYAALAASLPEGTSTSTDITLRRGAVFHDGSPVTPEDVVFSFERVMDKKNKSLYRSFLPFLKSVTRKDEHTVTFTTEYPVALLPNRLAVVKVVPKHLVEADHKAFDATPVGTGPWRMTDNGGSSKRLSFERFDGYTGPRPARAKYMNWQIIPDASTRSNAMQSRTVQAIDSVPYLSIDQLALTSKVESVLGFGLLFSMFNCAEQSPFHDKRNRQAFLHAVDYQKVIAVGVLGQAAPPKSFLQETHPAFHQASQVYKHDPERARELFAQTGLKKIRMLATDHDWVKNCTPLIQESLTDLGLEVEFAERKSSDLYNTIDGKPEAYDVAIAPGDPSVFGSDPNLLMSWWYGSDTWTDQRMHWKGSNGYAGVQKLLDAGLRATDDHAQDRAWGDALNAISEEVPLYPLLHRKAPTAWDATTLVGFKPIALTGLSFLDVQTVR